MNSKETDGVLFLIGKNATLLTNHRQTRRQEPIEFKLPKSMDTFSLKRPSEFE